MKKVSIIIITWNDEKFIGDCLDSVLSQKQAESEVIIVDNGSTDNTLEIIKSYKERVLLIQNDRNKGFCAANNQGIKASRGDFILTLNSDTVIEDGYISGLLETLEKYPDVGMVQGKFLRMDRSTIDSLGLKLGLFYRLFNIKEGEKDSKKPAEPFEIFGPCAAAALYRRKLVEDLSVKGQVFDERFFFLVEDFDLAWRAQKAGWKAMCVPQAVCYHYRESSAHKSGFKQYLSLRNRYYLLIKNIDPGVVSLSRLFLSFSFYDLPRFVFLLFLNPSILKAFREIRKNYRQLLRDRAMISDKAVNLSV